jgi:tripartite-type tricarboxylate transporter receptor subunit TctC
MKILRRSFLRLAAGAAALPLVARVASAQAYPARPVRIIVGFPAGSSADVFARLTGQWLSERLGRPFIIENRPGAGSSTAAEAALRAAPDGYTLLWTTAANTTNTAFYPNLAFNLIRDIAPVAGVIRTYFVLVVSPALPARSLPELIAYAKANPNKISMGIGGNGSLFHLASALFKMTAGIEMVDVVYRGDVLALNDLLGGQVQVMFAGSSAAIEHAKAGKLRALAVSTAMRRDELPEAPAVAEFVPGYEATGWQGLSAPKGTPAAIVEQLNREINAGLAQPATKARFADQGGAALSGSPAEFGTLIAADTEKWGKVIRAANIKAE